MGGDDPSPEGDTDPVTALRTAGNVALKDEKYEDAVTSYSEAIKGAPKDHRLYSNRAAAYSKLGKVCQSTPPRTLLSRSFLRHAQPAVHGLERPKRGGLPVLGLTDAV